jgi:hypothetical protein
MKISILDDYFDIFRTLPSFAKLAGHDVTGWNDHVQDTGALAERVLCAGKPSNVVHPQVLDAADRRR